ncbi:MAG TPA: RNA methyltransferase [Ktedonosporobacter sp.]|nr:RNA methyltransferase [Ktedonosporobacter sp.]
MTTSIRKEATTISNTVDRQVINNVNHYHIRRIHRLRLQDVRERTGLYYIEGLRFVSQAIARGVSIETLVVSRPLLKHPYAQRLIHQQQRIGTLVLEVTPAVLHSLSLVDDPQGIGAVVRQRWEPLQHIKVGEELCWIAHQFVRLPGNLGSILRTSEAVGGAGVILLDDTTDPYDPAVVRATMGAIFAQRFVRTNVAEFARWKQQHECMLVGTSPQATQDYHSTVYRRPTILLMGEERKGLTADLQALCDTMVRIPMVGQSDSLNLAIATSLLLYEVFNQRRMQVI